MAVLSDTGARSARSSRPVSSTATATTASASPKWLPMQAAGRRRRGTRRSGAVRTPPPGGSARGRTARGPASRRDGGGSPRADHHDGARRDAVAADAVAGGAAPPEGVGRRVQPHRLLDHHRRVREPAQVLGGGGPRGEDVVELLVDAALHVRVAAEQVEGEGQGRGGGLVPGEQEDQDLVAHLPRRERRAGLRVAGGEQPRDEVLGVARGVATPLDDGVDDRVERPHGRGRPPPGRGRPGGRQRDRGGGAAAGGLADDREGGADGRDGVVHAGAEQGPADHAQGVLDHLGVQVDPRRGGGRGPAVPQPCGLVGHHGHVAGDAAGGEQRGKGASLLAPALAVAGEQAVAERRGDLAVEEGVLGIALGAGGKVDHVAVLGHGALQGAELVAPELARQTQQQRPSRARHHAAASAGRRHGAPPGRTRKRRLALPLSGWRAMAGTDSAVTSAAWRPAPPRAAASRAASAGSSTPRGATTATWAPRRVWVTWYSTTSGVSTRTLRTTRGWTTTPS